MCLWVALTPISVTDQRSHINVFHSPRMTEHKLLIRWTGMVRAGVCHVSPWVRAALFTWILFATAQKPYGIGPCLVQHSVFSQLNLSISFMRSQCIPSLSRVSGLFVSALIDLVLTVWKSLWAGHTHETLCLLPLPEATSAPTPGSLLSPTAYHLWFL